MIVSLCVDVSRFKKKCVFNLGAITKIQEILTRAFSLLKISRVYLDQDSLNMATEVEKCVFPWAPTAKDRCPGLVSEHILILDNGYVAHTFILFLSSKILHANRTINHISYEG